MINSKGKSQAKPVEVTFVTFDSVCSGVARSQVVPYLIRLGKLGFRISLVNFETSPSPEIAELLLDAGIEWCPLPFGRGGPAGGLGRLARLVARMPRSRVIHARSDLPAVAALLLRRPFVIWDCRAFWVDQRIATGNIRSRSLTANISRLVEKWAARGSHHINVLTGSAVHRLVEKYGSEIQPKIGVISTCVDLEKFVKVESPKVRELRVLISGSMNSLYDIPRMIEILDALGAMVPINVFVATSDKYLWQQRLQHHSAVIDLFDYDEMPALIGQCHLGFSLCVERDDDSLLASMPTKIAEFLACGRPVLVNEGLVDVSRIIVESHCGVVATKHQNAVSIAKNLLELLQDEDLAERCRLTAERYFSLERAVRDLASIYRRGLKEA